MTCSEVFNGLQQMNEGVRNSLKHLRRFFTSLISIGQNSLNDSDFSAKVDVAFRDLCTNGADCEYYLTAIGYLEQISHISDALEVKHLLKDSNTINDPQIFLHPAFQAVSQICLQQRKEIEQLKELSQDSSVFLEKLNQVEAQKRLLEQKLRAISESSRDITDSYKKKINEQVLQIHSMKEQIENLERQNDALAKVKGKPIDSINAELNYVRTQLSNKSEKLRLQEEQNRQTLMIYATEMTELKEKMAMLEKPQEESSIKLKEILKTSVDSALLTDITMKLMEVLNEKREFLNEVLSFDTNDSYDQLSLQITSKKLIIDQQKEELQKQIEASKIAKEELDSLTSRESTLSKQVQDQANNTNQLKKSISKIKQRCELLQNEKIENDNEIENLKQQEQKYRQDYEESLKSINEAQIIVDNARNKVLEIQNHRSEAKEKYQKAESQIKELEVSVNTLQEQYDNQKCNLDRVLSKLAVIQSQKDQNQQFINDIAQQIESKTKETQDTLSELSQLEISVSQMDDQLRRQSSLLNNAISNIKSVETRKSQLCNKLKELEARIADELASC